MVEESVWLDPGNSIGLAKRDKMSGRHPPSLTLRRDLAVLSAVASAKAEAQRAKAGQRLVAR